MGGVGRCHHITLCHVLHARHALLHRVIQRLVQGLGGLRRLAVQLAEPAIRSTVTTCQCMVLLSCTQRSAAVLLVCTKLPGNTPTEQMLQTTWHM